MPIHRDKRTYVVGPGVDIELTCSESYLLDREEPTTCISQNILDPPVLPKCIRKFAWIVGYVGISSSLVRITVGQVPCFS